MTRRIVHFCRLDTRLSCRIDYADIIDQRDNEMLLVNDGKTDSEGFAELSGSDAQTLPGSSFPKVLLLQSTQRPCRCAMLFEDEGFSGAYSGIRACFAQCRVDH